MKIYTKQGDDGSASLLGGHLAPKDDVRFNALGGLDELSAWLGLLRCSASFDANEAEFLTQIQEDIVSMMAHVAALGGKEAAKYGFPAGLETGLEKRIDILLKGYEFSGSFTKSASEISAKADAARTVCRRAERALVSLGREYTCSAEVIKYINRLSDYLYALVLTL